MLEQFDAEAPADLKARVPKFKELLDDVRSKVGTLEIRCSPACDGARVLVDGRDIGKMPLPKTSLNAGSQKVDVIADGFAPYNNPAVDIVPKGTVLEVKLVRRDTILIVKSTPPSEALTVDGTEGPGTPRELNVLPGQHRLLLSRGGYLDVDATVVVPAGERKEVSYTLEKRSVLTRWWFWTIVGVVATGAAVTIGVAATTERGADTGTIPPGQIQAP
jgi:hypothetical protein